MTSRPRVHRYAPNAYSSSSDSPVLLSLEKLRPSLSRTSSQETLVETQRVLGDGAKRGVSRSSASIDPQFELPQYQSHYPFYQSPLLSPTERVPLLSRAIKWPNTLFSPELSMPQLTNPAPASSIYGGEGQRMSSIDKGTQTQAVDQAMSNENARSVPTTLATTPPGSLAQFVLPDSEPITKARDSSERELASPATVSPAPPSPITCDPSQSSHPSAQNSPRVATADTVHGPSNFPVLGLPCIQDRGNSPPPDRQSPLLQPHSQGLPPTSATLGGKLSPAASDASSFGWTEDGQDPALLRLISVSCGILLRAYLKLAGNTVPSESKQQDLNGSKQTKDSFGRQQSKSTTNSRKRKQNSSRDESDDGNDQPGSKRQQSESKGHSGFDVRPLACPFNKYDNRLFGPESPDDAYHICATCSFVSIAHLK